MTRPKILFFGDPHGDFSPVLRAVETHEPEAIVLLGDMQPKRPLHIELASIREHTDIWFIHGNHDTDCDADYDNVWGSELADRNLHGRVAEVAGLRVAGLGGIFRGAVWDGHLPIDECKYRNQEELLWRVTRGGKVTHDLWRDGISRKHRSSIFPADYESLIPEHADILVTHEAPGGHRLGYKVLDDLAGALGVKLLVHGHHHEDIDYVEAGRHEPASRYQVFAVDMGSALVWPEARLVRAAAR